MKVEIQHRVQDNALILTLLGKRVDVIVSPQLKKKALDLIEKHPTKKVILDLHHVDFIDSAGLVCFLSIWKMLNKNGSALRFARMTATVRQIVDLVLLNKVFDIFDSVEEATLDAK